MQNTHGTTDRAPTEQSNQDKIWIASVAAASAAGLLSAHQGQAAVVYVADSRTVDSTHFQNIDINSDSVNDFGIGASTNNIHLDKPSLSNSKQEYAVDPSTNTFVAALPFGEVIDSSKTYGQVGAFDKKSKTKNVPPLVNTDDSAVTTGPFTVAAGEQYIGIRFTALDGVHFGWIGFQTLNQAAGSLSGQITGYAYETDVATAITAGAVPEPSSLALLAMGTAGLAAYRGRRQR